MNFYCGKCGKKFPLNCLDYQCECGGLFKLEKAPGEKIVPTIKLGEITTPLLKRNLQGKEVYLKLDYMQPTGSFKDRGAFALINVLKELGIKEVVEDSSGNAGAAIAGYCAAAGIKCNIYLPAGTSPGKIKQIEAYKANVIKVPGTRDDTARAVREAARTTYYASHVYNPLFFAGVLSLAYELYEQIGVPDYIFVPVGNGTMLLGVYEGFKEIGKLPRLIAVQSKNCPPVYRKFHQLPPEESRDTVAEGIAVGAPARIDEIIAAIQESKGDIVAVDDVAVLAAQEMLGAMGLYVEATAGAAVAGMLQFFASDFDPNLKVVVPLTGMGLKK